MRPQIRFLIFTIFFQKCFLVYSTDTISLKGKWIIGIGNFTKYEKVDIETKYLMLDNQITYDKTHAFNQNNKIIIGKSIKKSNLILGITNQFMYDTNPYNRTWLLENGLFGRYYFNLAKNKLFFYPEIAVIHGYLKEIEFLYPFENREKLKIFNAGYFRMQYGGGVSYFISPKVALDLNFSFANYKIDSFTEKFKYSTNYTTYNGYKKHYRSYYEVYYKYKQLSIFIGFNILI
jgi:hypothetical protein